MTASTIPQVAQSATPGSSAEPGVLAIARLFYTVMFILLLSGIMGLARQAPTRFDVLTFTWVTGLTILLNLIPLRRWLERRSWLLSLVMLVATFAPLLADIGAGHVLQPGLAVFRIDDANRLYFWLLPPLLLISVQYRLRTVLAFTIVTSALPVVGIVAVGAATPVIEAYGTAAFIRLFLYGMVGYILVLVMAGQRARRTELARANQQLAQYASTLEQLTLARERNRLARELHDTLAHSLSAVSVQLKALDVLMQSDPDAARRLLHDIQSQTRLGLTEARRSLQALRARPVEELGLVMAIDRLAHQAAERAGLQLSLKLPLLVDGVPIELEQQVYRIAEEALTNIVRHASARHVAVELHALPHQLSLTVRDDGIGFEPSAEHAGHYGVDGMRERALLLDAILRIDSRPGHGTTVHLNANLYPA